MPQNRVGATYGTGYGTVVEAVWMISYLIPEWHGTATGLTLQVTYSSSQAATQTDLRFAVYSGGTVDDPTGAVLIEEWVENTTRVDWDAPTFTLTGVYPSGQPIWVVVKGQAGSGRNFHHYNDVPDWGPSGGWFISSSSVSNDPSASYPATWPTEGNPNGGTWNTNQKWEMVYDYVDLSPFIEFIDPPKEYASVGESVNIVGGNFGATKGVNDKVLILDAFTLDTSTVAVEASTASWADDEIELIIPTMPAFGLYNIMVVKDEGQPTEAEGSSTVPLIIEEGEPTVVHISQFTDGSLGPYLENAAGDNGDWSVVSSSGGNYGTGPDSGFQGGNFVEYTPANINDVANLDTITAYDPTTYRVYASFYYSLHWYFANGYAPGTFEVQVWDGSAWVTEFIRTSADTFQDASDSYFWNNKSLDLNSYTNSDVKVRFKGTANSSNYPDTNPFAVDDVVVYQWINATYKDASINITNDHALEGIGQRTRPSSTALSNSQDINASGILGITVDGSASLYHDHTIDAVYERSRDNGVQLGNVQLTDPLASIVIHDSIGIKSRNTLIMAAVGGSPVPPKQEYTFDVNDERINDISIPESDKRVRKEWDISYNTRGVGADCPISSAINSRPINAAGINNCVVNASGLSLIILELDMQYALGDAIFELGHEYPRLMELVASRWEIDQEYSVRAISLELDMQYALDSSGANLRESELGLEYLITSMDFVQELLDYVNNHRDNFGLAAIEGIWNGYGPDVSHIHSHNMGYVEYMAHNSLLFPVGWQTTAERVAYIQSADGVGAYGENILTTPASPALLAYGSTEPSAYPGTPREYFEAWKGSPPHNALMLSYWGDGAHPLMIFGSSTVNNTSNPLFISSYSTQIFVSYLPPGDKTLFKFELGQEWTVDVDLYKYISQEYMFDAYFKVRYAHESSYGLSVVSQHEALYETRAANQHVALIHYSMSVQHTAPYIELGVFNAQHEAPYDTIIETVANQHESIYNYIVSAEHEAAWGDFAIVNQQHVSTYTQFPIARNQHVSNYNNLSFIRAGHTALYDSPPMVVYQHTAQYNNLGYANAQHESVYTIFTINRKQHEATYTRVYPAVVQHESDWGILGHNTVVVDHSSYWTLQADTVIPPMLAPPRAYINGKWVELLETNIAIAESDPVWTCRMILKDLTYYGEFVEGALFTVDLRGEVYTFQYNTKSVDRGSPAESSIVVEGQSPAMSLRSPRSSSVTVSYDTATLASEIVEDILGQSVTWDFTDWYIPANLVVATNAQPLDLVVSILGTFGAIITSDLDGSLIVRSKYIVNTNAYPTSTVDHYYADLQDNLSASENYEARSGYNKYRVTDSDNDYGDVLEFIPDETNELKGVLRAYPTPWRLGILIKTTDAGTAFIGTQTWDTRDEEQVVEFVDGKGALSFIAESITSITWYSVSLGAIIHKQYESELTADLTVHNGYGLALVKYKVKCLICDTQGVAGTPVQYVIEDQ